MEHDAQFPRAAAGAGPPSPADDLMAASQFAGFALAYGSLPEDAAVLPALDPSASQLLEVSSEAHPQLPAVASTRWKNSHSSSDNGLEGDSSQIGNFFEDAAADDFGFSAQAQGRADGTDLGGRPKDGKGDATPAWSELKTKAGKERKRLPLACIACRRKKIRCSGEKPACKHCLRSRMPCVYKVTTRKAAPRTDYMAMLDKRLKRMEERIIKAVPKSVHDSGVASVARAVVKPTIPGTASAGKASSKKRHADEAFGPNLRAWARAPAKSAFGDPSRPSSLEVQEAEETQLFSEGAEVLPSKDIQEHLAEVFFDNIYGQSYHLLHKPSYMRKLRNNSLPPVLVLSVCAVSARFTRSPRLNSPARHFLRGEEWASRARDICIQRYEWPNITILTCLLILGLHEFGTCHGGRSWALGGQATRMAFALQLHKDLEYDPQSRNGKSELSFVDREIRRRVMWACFLMDRFNSSGTDRPMFIREETIKIPLPVKERNFQFGIAASTVTLHGSSDDEAHRSLGVAACIIRSIALWGRIITYLNQGGRETDPHPVWSHESEYANLAQQAKVLLESLPDCLRYSSANLELHRTETTANQFLLLHISMQQNILFLYRSALSARPQPGQEAPRDFLRDASEKAYAAANSISECVKDCESWQCTLRAPFAGYCVFSSTTIHILGIFSNNAQLKATAETNAGINIKFLRKLMKYWGMFHWMVEDIRAQFRAALEAAQAGAPAVGSNAASPILQYGDWFDRYPHGLSDAEFMDPAVVKKREKGADGVLEQKPELQSAKEFFETLSPSHAVEQKDTPRGAAPSKRNAVQKRASSSAAPGLRQQRHDNLARYAQAPSSGGTDGQPRRSTGLTPLAIPQPQNLDFNTLSSPNIVQTSQFSPSHVGQQGLFPSHMLSMNLNHQPTGIMQPLDRQLVFGGYSMEPGNISTMQNMMTGMGGWNDASNNGGLRDAKGAVSDAGYTQDQPHAMANHQMSGLNGDEASSAWFMPFNMEPPDANQDIHDGAADVLSSMFRGGNEMSNPNELGGLQHGS